MAGPTLFRSSKTTAWSTLYWSRNQVEMVQGRSFGMDTDCERSSPVGFLATSDLWVFRFRYPAQHSGTGQQQSRSRLAPKWQYLLRHLLLRTVCPPAPRNWVYLNQSDGSLDAHVRTRTFEHAPKLCACVHYRNSLRMCRSIFQAGNLISPSNMKSSLLLVWLGCEWTLELLLNDESNKPGVFNSEEKLWKQNVSATRVHMLPIASQLEATQCAYRVQFNLCRQKFAKQVSWSFESQRCEIMVQQNRYASWNEAHV